MCVLALLMPAREPFSCNSLAVVGGWEKRGMKAWWRGADLPLIKERLVEKKGG